MEASTCWGDLPWEMLSHVMEQLSRLLCQGGPLPLAQAARAAHAAAPNRHWGESARTELRLVVECDGGSAELQQLLHLAARVRLQGLYFRHSFEDSQAAAAVFELLTHGGFAQLAGRHLHQLAGAPCSLAAGKRALQHLPLEVYPQLERLQLYAPPYQQVLSLREAHRWQAAQQLRQLSISGRHYVAVRVLPPGLLQLSVSGWHVLIEAQLLAACPRVQLLAAAVLLSEHVLPYPAASTGPPAELLAELAGLLAGAGVPLGHRFELDTNMVCFQRANGQDARLVLRARPAAAEGQPADGGGGGGGDIVLAAAAGSVTASLTPPPAHSGWPAALGASGAGPEMSVLLQSV